MSHSDTSPEAEAVLNDLSRQRRDILGVMETHGSQLDQAYLQETAATLGVGKLLEQAFQDANF